MKSLPLPLRVAAGLAVTAVEQARDLPARIVGLPVTVASQALQLSMRVQQQVTALAIKGDEALAALRPVEETPEWATFDEDLDAGGYDLSRPAPFDRVADGGVEAAAPGLREVDSWPEVTRNGQAPVEPDDEDPDPWTQEEQALAREAEDDLPESTDGPAGVGGYDTLSLPQLRARLRRFSLAQLEELLDYERGHANRPAFVGMLSRRIATVRDHP
jgi:hypothetical protein